MKRPPTDSEKIFANDVTNKGLVFKIYNQLIPSKQTTQSKMSRRPT